MGVSKSKYLSFYLNRRSIKTSVESTNDVNHWDQLRPIGFDMCLLGLVQSHRTCICQETKAYTPRNYRRIRQETIDVYAFRTSISDLKGFAPRTGSLNRHSNSAQQIINSFFIFISGTSGEALAALSQTNLLNQRKSELPNIWPEEPKTRHPRRT